MKFTTVLSVIALVAPALATPVAAPDAAVVEVEARNVEVEARTGGGENKCNNNQKQVCCTSVLSVTCLLGSLVGGQCNGQSYCCDSTAPQNGLINLNVLNCVKVG